MATLEDGKQNSQLRRLCCGICVFAFLPHVCQGIMYIWQNSRLPCFGNIF